MGSINRDEARQNVGSGWAGLIDQIYNRMPEGTSVIDVKEKFGGLRVYVYGATEVFWDFLMEMEDKSLETCELCGKPGNPRNTGWVKTLCDGHYQERQNERSTA